MIIRMRFQFLFCPKRSDAILLWTDKFTDFSVNHQEVIHHSVISGAIHKANWANGLPSVIFSMFQHMCSVRIRFGWESLEANATSDWRSRCARSRFIDVHVVVGLTIVGLIIVGLTIVGVAHFRFNVHIVGALVGSVIS